MLSSRVGSIILHGDLRCLNRCTFCPGVLVDSKTPKKKLEQFKKDARYFIDLDFKKIEISGNDPIQFSQIYSAILYLKDQGILDITLSTHGRPFKDKTVSDNLKSAGLTSVRIPLYGSNEETHNKVTQYVATGEKPLSVGNSFKDTVKAIKNCVESGIKVNAHIVPLKYNMHDIKNIIDLYLELTSGFMDSIIISSSCISNVDEEYTSDWYLPLKDTSDVVSSVIDHPLKEKYPHIFYKILDFPFCSIGKIHEDVWNNSTLPNLGSAILYKRVQSEKDPQVPHYRTKKHFKDCSNCLANKVCAGLYVNDINMFGSGKLKPITLETILNKDYLKNN